jgi:hypothetical protein
LDRQILFPFATLAQPLEKTVSVSRSASKEIMCVPKEAKEKKRTKKKEKEKYLFRLTTSSCETSATQRRYLLHSEESKSGRFGSQEEARGICQ